MTYSEMCALLRRIGSADGRLLVDIVTADQEFMAQEPDSAAAVAEITGPWFVSVHDQIVHSGAMFIYAEDFDAYTDVMALDLDPFSTFVSLGSDGDGRLSWPDVLRAGYH